MLAALLLPSVALAGAPAGVTAATVTPTAPNITLRCARVIPAGHPAHERVVCRWTAVTGVDVRAYRLYRFVDAPPRPSAPARRPCHPGQAAPRRRLEHLATATATATASSPSAPTGRASATATLVSLRVGRPAQALAMNCAFLIDAATPGRRVPLERRDQPTGRRASTSSYRSVDGGARQWLYRTGRPTAPVASSTRDVTAGQTIRYKVIAVTADGRVVGIGRDSIVVPTVVTPTAS